MNADSGHFEHHCVIALPRLFIGFNTDSSVLENCIFGVLLKANTYNITILKLNSVLTCNLAHNGQMDVSVFSVIFNNFCSVL